MDKIKLIGVKNIPFEGDINEDKEYLLAMVVNSDGTFIPSKHGEEVGTKTFHLKVDHIDLLQEVGGRKIEIRKGQTTGQNIMWAIRDWKKRNGGEGSYEEYETEGEKIIEHYRNKE